MYDIINIGLDFLTVFLISFMSFSKLIILFIKNTFSLTLGIIPIIFMLFLNLVLVRFINKKKKKIRKSINHQEYSTL